MVDQEFARSFDEQLEMMGRSIKDLEMRRNALTWLKEVELSVRPAVAKLPPDQAAAALTVIADGYAVIMFGLCERATPERMAEAVTKVQAKIDEALSAHTRPAES